MFIEAGDVTHRRRVKIVMSDFSKNCFYTKFFWPKFVYFGIIRPEMMKINIFGKSKFWPP